LKIANSAWLGEIARLGVLLFYAMAALPTRPLSYSPTRSTITDTRPTAAVNVSSGGTGSSGAESFALRRRGCLRRFAEGGLNVDEREVSEVCLRQTGSRISREPHYRRDSFVIREAKFAKSLSIDCCNSGSFHLERRVTFGEIILVVANQVDAFSRLSTKRTALPLKRQDLGYPRSHLLWRACKVAPDSGLSLFGNIAQHLSPATSQTRRQLREGNAGELALSLTLRLLQGGDFELFSRRSFLLHSESGFNARNTSTFTRQEDSPSSRAALAATSLFAVAEWRCRTDRPRARVKPSSPTITR